MIKQAKVNLALQNVKARNAIARLVKLAAGQETRYHNTRRQKQKEAIPEILAAIMRYVPAAQKHGTK